MVLEPLFYVVALLSVFVHGMGKAGFGMGPYQTQLYPSHEQRQIAELQRKIMALKPCL